MVLFAAARQVVFASLFFGNVTAVKNNDIPLENVRLSL